MAKIDTPFYLETAEHIYITYLETGVERVSLKTHFPSERSVETHNDADTCMTDRAGSFTCVPLRGGDKGFWRVPVNLSQRLLPLPDPDSSASAGGRAGPLF